MSSNQQSGIVASNLKTNASCNILDLVQPIQWNPFNTDKHHGDTPMLLLSECLHLGGYKVKDTQIFYR